MGRVLKMSMTAVFLLATAAWAVEPAQQASFHPERWGKAIEFGPVDRYTIQWTFNFQDFLAEQTRQLRIEVEKFKPVRLIREEPLSSTQRGPYAQLEEEQYPSVQFSAARW